MKEGLHNSGDVEMLGKVDVMDAKEGRRVERWV